ncbi:MAG TPA: histidine triad nucleotide-binding protein [Chthoniobacterales bacterium]|jgi:histidine triad (HIT) family protein
MTLFEKLIARELPSEIVHEDDDVFAFRDIAPQAPTHILIIPKRLIVRLGEATPDDGAVLGKLLLTAAEIARKLGLASDGYRLVINNGRDAGEAVPHLHVHLLAGRRLAWPPG